MALGICSFCGEFTEGEIAFFAVDDTGICIHCIDKFSGIATEYEENKKVVKEGVKIHTPVKKHNFKVIEGGKA